MIETIGDEYEIEQLYKNGTNAPYSKVEDGFGYYGVLLLKKDTGLVQCHVCGDWFKSVGNHSAKIHHIKAREYKKKFGFSLSHPICWKQLSARISELNQGKLQAGKIGPKNPNARLNRGNPLIAKNGHYRQTVSFWNDRAICPEQIVSRVVAIGDDLGKQPTFRDIQKIEPSLATLIVRRFDSWTKFCTDNGFKIRDYKSGKKANPENVLFSLRKWQSIYSRIPTTSEYAKTSSLYSLSEIHTVFKHFGSWNRALSCAGLITESINNQPQGEPE